MADLKERLEMLKEERGINNKQLVAQYNEQPPLDIKISETLVSDILTKTSNKKDGGSVRSVDYQRIGKLAQFFDVSIEYLCGWSDIRKTASDNVEIAAATTGLSQDTIKMLTELKKTENAHVIMDAINLLVYDAHIRTSKSGWVGGSMTLCDIEWSSPESPQAYDCFLSDFYNLCNAPLLYEDKNGEDQPTILLRPDNGGPAIEAPRDLWATYYSNRALADIQEITNWKRRQLNELIHRGQHDAIELIKNAINKEEGKKATNKKRKNSNQEG